MGYFRGNGGKKTKTRWERRSWLKGGLGGMDGTLGTFFSYDPPLLLLSTSYQTRIAYVSLRIVSVLFPLLEARTIERRKKDERRMNEGWYGNDTGLIRTRYVTDSFSRRSADLVGLRFCFIALIVFEVDNDSPCQLLTVITDTKLRNGATECKSIHNRLQSVYNPFIIRSFRSKFNYPFSHK